MLAQRHFSGPAQRRLSAPVQRRLSAIIRKTVGVIIWKALRHSQATHQIADHEKYVCTDRQPERLVRDEAGY